VADKHPVVDGPVKDVDGLLRVEVFAELEEVPGSSPGRPTTISTFIPQTGSVAILSFTLIFAFLKVS
jgi:hypothetical protein